MRICFLSPCPVLPSKSKPSSTCQVLQFSPRCCKSPPPIRRARLPIPFRPSEKTPALLRRPEAVIAATAVALFMLAASALRSVRETFEIIRRGAIGVTEMGDLRAKLRKKKQENEFLKSAVDATRASVENMDVFLRVQKRRVEIVEERLERVTKEKEEVENVLKRVKEREAVVDELRIEMEREKKEGVAEWRVDEIKGKLEGVERQVNMERNVLQKVQQELRERVEKERKEVAQLREDVRGRNANLDKERRERNIGKERYQLVEQRLEKVRGEFEGTLDELAERRRRIETVEEQTKRIKRIVKKKTQEIAINEGKLSHNVKAEIDRLKGERHKFGQLVDHAERGHQNGLGRLQELYKAIADADEKLALLYQSIERTESKDVSDNPGSDIGNLAQDTKVEHLLDNMPTQIPGMIFEDQHNLQPTTAASVQTDTQMETRGSASTSMDAQQEPQQKRRRGRPRKNPVTDAVKSQPKSRGRPRKVKQDSSMTEEEPAAPKRKRGRPRKKPVPPLVSQQTE